jgi:hypothetical protein
MAVLVLSAVTCLLALATCLLLLPAYLPPTQQPAFNLPSRLPLAAHP